MTMKRRLAVAGAALVLLTSLGQGTIFASHGTANNYWHVHWAYSSAPVTTTYRISLQNENGASYTTPINNAAANWNTAANNSYTRHAWIPSGTPDTWITVDYLGDEIWSGMAFTYPNWSTATSPTHLSWADYTLNSKVIEEGIDNQDWPSDFREKAATHEFGHTVGLAHPAGTSEDAVMRQGWYGFTDPQNRDIYVLSWSQLYGGHSHPH